MPAPLFDPFPNSILHDSHVLVQYHSFQRGVRDIQKFANPDHLEGVVVDEGQYKLPKPLAVAFIRFYINTAESLIRKAKAFVNEADNVMLAHKEWLRLEFEEELRVGISTRMGKIYLGVVDVQDKRDDLADVRGMIESHEGSLLAKARERENEVLEQPENSLVDWDISSDLRISDYLDACLVHLSERM